MVANPWRVTVVPAPFLEARCVEIREFGVPVEVGFVPRNFERGHAKLHRWNIEKAPRIFGERLLPQNGCPSAATLRTSSETGEIGTCSRMVFRTKSVSIGLVVGINTARSGQTCGLYYEAAEGLIPLQPFPSVQKMPTLQEIAAGMPAPQTLGEKIRYLRLRKGLRQNELAKALGVYNTAVCQWEKNLTKPRPKLLCRITQFLGQSPSNSLKARQA